MQLVEQVVGALISGVYLTVKTWIFLEAACILAKGTEPRAVRVAFAACAGLAGLLAFAFMQPAFGAFWAGLTVYLIEHAVFFTYIFVYARHLLRRAYWRELWQRGLASPLLEPSYWQKQAGGLGAYWRRFKEWLARLRTR